VAIYTIKRDEKIDLFSATMLKDWGLIEDPQTHEASFVRFVDGPVNEVVDIDSGPGTTTARIHVHAVRAVIPMPFA